MANRTVEFLISARDKTKAAVESVKSRLKGLSASVASFTRLGPLLSGAAVGAGAASLKSFADEADRVGKAAEKLAISPEEFSKLAYVAEKANIPITDLERNLQKMTRKVGDAANGNKSAIELFESLGLSVERLRSLRPEQQFELIAEAISAMDGETEQLSATVKVFDSEGANMVRIVRQGTSELKRLKEEAEETGKVFSKELTEQAAQFNDNYAQLAANLEGQKIKAFGPLVQGANELMVALKDGPKSVADLRTELENLERHQRRAEENAFVRFLSNSEELEENLKRVRKELKRLEDEEKERDRQQEVREQKTREEAQATQILAQARKDAVKAMEPQKTEAKKNLQKETGEYEQAQKKQTEIAKEQGKLREEVLATKNRKDKPVTGVDVQLEVLKATQALAKGNAEASSQAAERAASMLRDLAAQGQEADHVLGYLADRIDEVKGKAAEATTENEKSDVGIAQQQLDEIEARIEALKNSEIVLPNFNMQEAIAKAKQDLANANLQATVQVNVDTSAIKAQIMAAVQAALAKEVTKRGVNQ